MSSQACPYCGTSLSAEARYCDRCGTPLTETATRTPSRLRQGMPGRISVWTFCLVMLLIFGSGTLGGYRYMAGEWPTLPGKALLTTTKPRSGPLPSFPSSQDAAAVAEFQRSIVAINVWGRNGTASGSGFVINDNGQILTNAHVVEGDDNCLTVTDEEGQTHQAMLVGRDANVDVALLSVPALRGRTNKLALGDSSKIGPTDSMWVLGSLKGPGSAPTYRATVSQTGANLEIDNRPYKGLITLNGAAVYPGTSGGPLIDTRSGQVVGIVTAGDQEGLAYAVPVSQVDPLLNNWRTLQGRTTCTESVATHLEKVILSTITPLSGPEGVPGEDLVDGVRLALRDMEQDLRKVGYEVELRPNDDQGSVVTGAEKARSVAYNDRAIGVIGSLNSQVTRSIARELQPSGLVMVAPLAGADDLTTYGWTHFNRLVAMAGQQEPATARFAVQLGVKAVMLLNDGTPEAAQQMRAFEQAAKAEGLTVVWRGNVGDVGQIKSKIIETKPDAIYYAGKGQNTFPLVQALRKEGNLIPVLGGPSLNDPLFGTLTGGSQRVYFTNLTASSSEAFQKRFENILNKPERGYAAYGYDSARIILEALRRYGETNQGKMPNREALATLVRQTKGHNGWAANATFDGAGNNRTSWVYVYEWSNGYPQLQLNLQPDQ